MTNAEKSFADGKQLPWFFLSDTDEDSPKPKALRIF